MWKLIWVLIVFNTTTNSFEKVEVTEKKLHDYTELIYGRDGINAILGMKYKNQKIIKEIKDSVYIPDDSCYYEQVPGHGVYFLKD